MDSVKKTLDGARAGWDKLDKKKKITMISAIVAIVVIVFIFTYNLNKIDYALLFKDLELDDAGVIVTDLETNKINYKLENNGRNILIDKDMVDEYRLQLAMNGMMPESSTGFEIFDDTGMMVTEEDRQIMYQRALTGELQRSIMSLDSVESAKVHLVMPEKSIFQTEDKQASASVVLGIKTSQNVTPDMINGIVSLISGAVDNLPKENVQVIDTKGNLLSGFLAEGETKTTTDIVSQHQGIREDFERQIESKIKELLGSTFGWDKINVSVLADLDFDSEEKTSILYSNAVPRSQQYEASGDNIDMQQVTGGSIDDNISNVIDGVEGENSNYRSIINNEISSETTNTIQAPGKINRMTTSVVYKGALSDLNLKKMQNIVAAATGYDSDRGDIISVESINISGQAGEIDQNLIGEGEEVVEEGIKAYLPIIFRVAGILVLLLIVVITVKNLRKKKKGDQQFQEQLTVGNTVEDTLSDIEESYDIKIQKDQKGEKAKEYADENPGLVADLIRSWMKDQG
ncbi:MAG: flagellar basal-body MS-ring/collar protein FliF [Tissierellia bacterium]|nr:flagellar basal-body MS-ring/collar protein FliF [Tissierellia bacterium]